ncbi:DUF2753 family protein [Vibrio sinaloensis]|nr:DUF2753 family protein [Vibrio sinaloensis]
MLTLVPQCPNTDCDAFIDSMGCCKKSADRVYEASSKSKKIAQLVQDIDTATNCNLIAKFRLN